VRRVVITGVGCLSAAGVGKDPFLASLLADRPPAEPVEVEGVHGPRRPLRLAFIPAFDREFFLPSRKLRRMGDLSQLWVIACLLALSDSGRDVSSPLPPPERRGVFLGTGFGCIDTTWQYLEGMFRDGAALANPFLFSESVANAPAGHSAIELNARGANLTLTCGDASAAAALERGARWIREGRLEMAWCGGVETMPRPLLRILANLSAPPFVGEGCVCFLLETLEAARSRKAKIHAEVAGGALGSDPGAPPLEWSRDSHAIARVLGRALDSCDREQPRPAAVFRVYLHAPGLPLCDAAERAAAERLLPGAERITLTEKAGAFAAAGGFPLLAAALDLSGRSGTDAGEAAHLVSASSWGGGLAALLLRGASC
jgi:3-oxoacyl-[acyl-carrier-protein] synthase II